MVPHELDVDADDDAEPDEAPDAVVDELDELDEQAARPRPATRARVAVPPMVTALIYVSFDGGLEYARSGLVRPAVR